MSFQNLGQNTTVNFFEEIIYGVGSQEARTRIANYTNIIESSILQDAAQSSLNMLAMGVIMKVIQAIENMIESLFNIAKGLIVLLIGSSWFSSKVSKLKSLKGIKAIKNLPFFSSAFSDRIQLSRLVNDMTRNHIEANKLAQKETDTIKTGMSVHQHVMTREGHNMKFADIMAKRYTDTFLPKLMTKSFTASDIPTIKEVFGRDSGSEMDIELLNSVADFMFVVDDQNKVTGLTSAFFSILNGLGYIHNK